MNRMEQGVILTHKAKPFMFHDVKRITPSHREHQFKPKKLFNKILKIMEKNMFHQMCKNSSLFFKLLKPLSPQQKNNSSK
jgi:hypothetical protein